MNNYISIEGYQVEANLYKLVNESILPKTGIEQAAFWSSFSTLFNDFIPINKALLVKREQLQQQIDDWHLSQEGTLFSPNKYKSFLKEIGYLVPEVEDFTVSTTNVDDEVATIAGPQLVVPLMNARFALNAANARWGSLYDALYGTDVIDDKDGSHITPTFNKKRGNKVVAFARKFLDETLPLTTGSHSNTSRYFIDDNVLKVQLNNGEISELKQPESLIGLNGTKEQPRSILFKHHGLHIDILFDDQDSIGKDDAAHIKDIVLESAISVIQDCEDSIAAVDSEDKVAVYKNWLGLMQGTLQESLSKNGKVITRKLNAERHYQSLTGETMTLSGRSLLFIRNVGHLMTTDAVLTPQGEEVPEGILDGIITSLISLHDIKGNSHFCNSKKGSIYIVKPKMHGPEEVQFSNDLFARIEQILMLPENTIKMGIMDEERRTSANLKSCIAAAKSRVAFINTGFLDRTGDEIHTSMLAGAMVPKDEMKNEPWINAYETRNVHIGLATGLQGKAQIGKGMWAIPDQMAQMLNDKINHPLSGANCAWVPSPTAATLHVMHYHQVDVFARQNEILVNINKQCDENDDLCNLLTIPLIKDQSTLSDRLIQNELDNNIQGLLGYVVRWIDQGVGCSKVPDIDNIARMEDRATLRISSQHVCNWLEHGIINDQQVLDSMERMAGVVDKQNEHDPNYVAMSKNLATSIAYKAGLALIFQGKIQPSGYTEPLLHKSRKKVKNNL